MPRIPQNNTDKKKEAMAYLKELILSNPFVEAIEKYSQPIFHPSGKKQAEVKQAYPSAPDTSEMTLKERLRADAEYKEQMMDYLK